MNGPRRTYDIAGLYDLEKTLGKGHFAVVKLARHVFTGEKVAVKVIDKTKLDAISKEHLFQEVTCMKLVQHPHVVRLYEVIDTQSKLYLVMELADGGDLYEYIMKHKNGLDEPKAQQYFKQIVQAINYCHRLHVVHRDLKPENVVFFEKFGAVKLTDFGFSTLFEPGKAAKTSCGSLAYSAPEVLLGDSYDAPAADVWSLGVILFMLVAGTAPFDEANDSETLFKILDCKFQVPGNISEDCSSLIQRMLVRDPSKRLSLEDILEDPWVEEGDASSNMAVPLISRSQLSEEQHNFIVQRMVNGKIASREDIQAAVDRDSYNHITATYFLMAERLLKKEEKERRNAALQQAGRHLKPQTGLSPLALSPRVQSADSNSRLNRHRGSIDSLVSPPGTHPTVTFAAPAPTPPRPVVEAKPTFKPRKLSLLQEVTMEMEEEEEPPVHGCFPRGRSRRDSRTSREDASQSEDSDHSRSSSLDRQESGSRGVTQVTPNTRRAQPLRPLKSVRSSPNMLNEIYEEIESDGEGEIPRRFSPHKPMRAEVSPQVLRKVETQRVQRKRVPSRVTSASSSDASDTDDTDPSKRRSKDKLKHRFTRRDSSDHSSDTDAGPGTGGFGSGGRGFGSAGGRRSGGGGDSDRNGGNGGGSDDSSRQSPKSKERRSSGGSNSGGSSRHHVLPTIPAVHEPPTEGMCAEITCGVGKTCTQHVSEGYTFKNKNDSMEEEEENITWDTDQAFVKDTCNMIKQQKDKNNKCHENSSASMRNEGVLEALGRRLSALSMTSHNSSVTSHKYAISESHHDSASLILRAPNPDILADASNKYKNSVINVRSKNFSDLMTQFKADLSDSEADSIGGFKTQDVVTNVRFKRKAKHTSVSHVTDETGRDEITVSSTSGTVCLVQGGGSVETKCCSVV